MTFPHGSRTAASSVSFVAVVAGCNTSYTPALELWPPAADASSAALSASPAYDASSSSTPDGPALPTAVPTSIGNFYDAAFTVPLDTGAQPLPRMGVDASLPDSGSMFSMAGGYDAATVADAAPHQPPDAGTPKPHALTVVVTTVDDFMGYSPADVGAIWVAQSSGAFVKTLEVWAKARIDHLVLWNSATKAAGLSRNTVDAITGATQYAFGTHVVYWNFTDTTGKVVPDGAYRLYFETADDNATGPNTFVNFTKGPTAATFTFPDTPHFIDLKLVLSP
jgi:hypothetical protein